MSILSKLQALLTAANTKTGESDTTITDAMQTLVDGYGQGGGSSNYATGLVTLSTDLSLTTSPKNIPGLQLSFQPDFFYIAPERTSFETRENYDGGLWSFVAIKKSIVAPYAVSVTETPETITTNDYVFFISTSLIDNTSINCGHGIKNFGFLSDSYYGRFLINSDGTVSVGRYSSAGTEMHAGTYRYFACKI